MVFLSVLGLHILCGLAFLAVGFVIDTIFRPYAKESSLVLFMLGLGVALPLLSLQSALKRMLVPPIFQTVVGFAIHATFGLLVFLSARQVVRRLGSKHDRSSASTLTSTLHPMTETLSSVRPSPLLAVQWFESV